MYRVEISPARRRTLVLVTVVFSALVLSTFAVGGARIGNAGRNCKPQCLRTGRKAGSWGWIHSSQEV